MVKGGTIGLNETQMGYSPPKWFVEAMEDVIGRRQSEMALTLGKMFSAEEANKIGMVDEVAETKEDAFSKSVTFIEQFKKISPVARKTTKMLIRKERIEVSINLFLW